MRVREEQKIGGAWVPLVLMVLVMSFFIVAYYFQEVEGRSLGENPMSSAGLLATGAMLMLLFFILYLWFRNMRLLTVVSKDGIKVKYLPFQKQFKEYRFSELSEAYVREYRAFTEFGGRGYKQGSKNKAGISYTVRGNKGIQLVRKDGLKIFIGTQRPVAMQRALNQHFRHGS